MRNSKEASTRSPIGLLHFVHCWLSCNRTRCAFVCTTDCGASRQSKGRAYQKHGSDFRHIITFHSCVTRSHMSVCKVYGKLRYELPRLHSKNRAILRQTSRGFGLCVFICATHGWIRPPLKRERELRNTQPNGSGLLHLRSSQHGLLRHHIRYQTENGSVMLQADPIGNGGLPTADGPTTPF